MNDDMAKYMLHEMRSIWRYDAILKDVQEELERISEEIESVLSPACPNGKTGPKIENSSTTKQTIVNSLLSDEMELMERQTKFNGLKADAKKYRICFLAAAESDEMEFAQKVVDGVSYTKIERDCGYSNAFDKAVRICKRLRF